MSQSLSTKDTAKVAHKNDQDTARVVEVREAFLLPIGAIDFRLGQIVVNAFHVNSPVGSLLLRE